MYYKLVFDDGIYYSKPVLASFLHVGDDGFQRLVMDGTVTPRSILGRLVYALSSPSAKESERIDREFYPKVQLVDETLRTIKDCAKAGDGTMTLFARGGAETWSYRGESFVRLSDVRSRSLYRDQHRLPTIDICGTRFIAVGRVMSGEKISVALG